MKISSSNVSMQAFSSYYKNTAVKTTVMKGLNVLNRSSTTDVNEITDKNLADLPPEEQAKRLAEEQKKDKRQYIGQDDPNAGGIYSSRATRSASSLPSPSSKLDLLKKLLEQLMNIGKSKYQIINMDENNFSWFGGIVSPALATQGGSSYVRYDKTEVETSIYEKETLSFQAGGVIQTEDGREINFSAELNMSREFAEKINASSFSSETVFVDPLVINMDNMPAGVTDVTFKFDIDADGEEDEIARLKSGSGFLALDKNGDGKINDGSELFGAKTGDGFKELAAYDEDGNGWIDENDSVYQKLSVWTKDENGQDKLISLKDADVGAIYLGQAIGGFSLTDGDNNVNAEVKATGVYLKESSGEAGTVQQLDFAKKGVTA